MSDLAPSRLWTMRAAFVLLVLIILFFHMLPLQTATGGWIWPDLILTFAIAWSVRRPDYVPVLLLGGCFLLADLLLQRPPGLWAVLALIACASMQTQARSLRDASLMAEFASAAAWIVGIGIGYRLVLAVLLVETPALIPALGQIVITVLAYPVVVAVTHALMGVRKSAPHDIDGSGVRT
ncbi:rod shape-determining protein MreD [Tateyamaria sp. SN6-1]|uniref:rod shape-determining protein MreD n=1 Tax=Tateyamaria sp. SN6-1 TaxID=3092148 RepID=UPI0039F54931